MVGLTIVELEGVSGSITLDTQLIEAYSGITSLNNSMSGDLPILTPGMNAVSWCGNVTKVEMQPNWRYLL
jgi:phage-related protein